MRITVDIIKEAYQKLGAKPHQGSYGDYHTCCGLGALSYSSGSNNPTSFVDSIYGWDYRLGFVNGFDGKPNSSRQYVSDFVRYEEGLEDGRAAWEAMS